MDFEKNVPTIEKTIGYTFRDGSLLRQAFTRASFCNENNYGQREPYQSNEVLEFFGDSILSATIITSLIKMKSKRYSKGIKTELTEGDFSNIRSHLADKKNLSENIQRLGLQKYLIMGEGDAKLGIENERSVMEDLFESLIGAVYIDSSFDMEAVTAVIERMLDLSVYLTASNKAIQSYKNMVQEWCADKKRRLPPPVYEKRGEEGPDHNKTYTCVCIVDGKELGMGKARSVKLAESEAAKAALEALGLI
ncbi:MAG: ribonuclease III family protein [Ruminococcaceae bacterium]|nr:ribonuclease III family protein [Oscillospiraceae bacterium]